MSQPTVLLLTVHDQVMSPFSMMWRSWCDAEGVSHLPAAPETIASLITRHAHPGEATHIPEMMLTAISHMHRDVGLPDPVYHPEVTEAMAALAAAKRGQPSNPLSLRCLNVALLAAQQAQDSKRQDAALEAALTILLLREAGLLLSSELVHITYADIAAADGRAWLRLPRQEPVPVSPLLAETAARILPEDPSKPVIPVTQASLNGRIRTMTKSVGLGTGYTQLSGSSGALLDVLTTEPPRCRDQEESGTERARNRVVKLLRHARREPV